MAKDLLKKSGVLLRKSKELKLNFVTNMKNTKEKRDRFGLECINSKVIKDFQPK